MASDGPGCEMAKTVLACPVNTRADYLMCRPHWWQVSRPTQQQVYASLDAEGPLGDGYLDTVERAVNEVLERRGQPGNWVHPRRQA